VEFKTSNKVFEKSNFLPERIEKEKHQLLSLNPQINLVSLEKRSATRKAEAEPESGIG